MVKSNTNNCLHSSGKLDVIKPSPIPSFACMWNFTYRQKGWAKRLNQTLQSRPPVELRIKSISTIEEANKFLVSYLQEYNDSLVLPLNSTKTVFEKQPSSKKKKR